MKKVVERIPTYALGYMVNGDPTSLTDEEVKEIDTLCRERKIELVCPISETIEGGVLPYFSSSPLFGKPTEVEDCIIICRDKAPGHTV